MEFDEEIASTLYLCSCGITGVMIYLVIAAQLEALHLKRERIDAQLIQRVYQTKFTPLHEILDVLRLGRQDIQDKFDDLYKKKMNEVMSDPLATVRRALEETERRNAQKVGANPKNRDVYKRSLQKTGRDNVHHAHKTTARSSSLGAARARK